jgi:hypothetical protein
MSHVYNLIYFKTFKENFEQQDPIYTTTTSFYNSWMKLMDREINKELKSYSFKSLLTDYTNSIIEVHSLYRKLGYPVDYFDWAHFPKGIYAFIISIKRQQVI